MDIFTQMQLSDGVEEGHIPLYVNGTRKALKVGSVVRYTKANNLREYAGKILSFTLGNAFPLKIETSMEFGKTITSHRLEDFTSFIQGEQLHAAINTARRTNEQYAN